MVPVTQDTLTVELYLEEKVTYERDSLPNDGARAGNIITTVSSTSSEVIFADLPCNIL